MAGPVGAVVASMGPRPIGRGEPAPHDFQDYRFQLQWGRDQLVAERVEFPAELLEQFQLQWGRDQLVAESLSAA